MNSLVQISPSNGHAPVSSITPGPAPQGDAGAAELGAVLSPSQVNTFLSCPAKWYFKYLRGLPDPKTGALALGIAAHRAIAWFMKSKIAKDPLPDAEVCELFSDAWDEEIRQAELREDEDADDLHDQGRGLVACYLREAAPLIEPAKVEFRVAGKVGGVDVQGYVDLLDVDGRIIDTKTRAKKPAGIPPDYRLQVTTYTLISPDARGQARVDFIVKNKTPKVVSHSTEIEASDVAYAEAIYPMVQESIRDGVFYPRRSDQFPCTRRYCPFWRACESEFGGRVAE